MYNPDIFYVHYLITKYYKNFESKKEAEIKKLVYMLYLYMHLATYVYV